jgi:hypothetical protein
VRKVFSAVNVRGPVHSEGPHSFLPAGLIRSRRLIQLVHFLAVSCHVMPVFQLVSNFVVQRKLNLFLSGK